MSVLPRIQLQYKGAIFPTIECEHASLTSPISQACSEDRSLQAQGVVLPVEVTKLQQEAVQHLQMCRPCFMQITS